MTDRQSTHSHDCWGWGPKHYECAVREIEALRAERDAQQRPAEGEEIMVSTPYDVFILPLQPSGLSSGQRFVVHVPGPELPAQQWRDLAIASVTILEEIREIVGLKGKCGDVVEAVRKLATND